ncbi:NIPSNAP family containing protein [Pedobacter sp. Leaf216]|uniref:NIPSNAP family protein n=1 Tax=Pedobacter sp. Leaf216 TaxID=1735684 RepID=UPI0006FE8565|nr:NIPSNAP family protein [Pedobacter sp. Leaf216]KQM78076.1 NIPSNAP family containing protein [Pedobacter sp. Leaf216]
MLRKTKITCLFFLILLSNVFAANAAKLDFYQIKIYHLKTDAQEQTVDNYLQNAYLPALHRAGIAKVGVFKPVITDPAAVTEKLIYVFIPLKSFNGILDLDKKLAKDQQFATDGKTYLDAAYSDVPYERLESIVLKAFENAPNFMLPKLKSPMKERVYELRSYEAPTEKYFQNKVQMFNKGDEIGLFKRLNFNAVFYGEVLSGSHMPNLMYLTTFENKADRDAHWKAFSADDYWKKLSAMPEYQHNVSKNDTKFVYPTDYSDI